MANQIPEKIVNFEAYDSETGRFLGLVDITNPSIEPMTSTVSGAGIGGEIEVPTLGHFKSMEVQFSWRTVTDAALALEEPKAHTISLYAAQQELDAGTGELKVVSIKEVVRGRMKKDDLGKLAVGADTGATTTLELDYFKLDKDDTNVIEIDKYNQIFKVNGKDYLSDVRRALGL